MKIHSACYLAGRGLVRYRNKPDKSIHLQIVRHQQDSNINKVNKCGGNGEGRVGMSVSTGGHGACESTRAHVHEGHMVESRESFCKVIAALRHTYELRTAMHHQS